MSFTNIIGLIVLSSVLSFNPVLFVKERLKTVILDILSVFISCVSTSIIFLFYKSELTVYELLFVVAIFSILISKVLYPIVISKNNIGETLLKGTCYLSVIVASYSILTYGQINIHSDSATASLLVKSMIDNISLIPSSWNYANGDVWILGSHLFVFLPQIFISDVSLARMIGIVAYIFFTSFAVIILSRKVFNSDFGCLALPVLLVYFSFSGLDHILYQASYTSAILFPCLLLLMFICTKQNVRYKNCFAFLFVLFIFALCSAGKRWVAEVTLPFILTVFFIYFRDKENKSHNTNEFFKDLCLIVIPSVLGFAINFYLCHSNYYHVHFTSNDDLILPNSITDLYNNIQVTLANFFYNFGYNGNVKIFSLLGLNSIVSIFVCIAFCFVIPIFQLRKLNKESKDVIFFVSYALIHNIIMLSIIILSSKLVERYLLSTIIMFILVSSRYVYVYWIRGSNVSVKYLVIFAFILSTIIQSVHLISVSNGWKYVLDAKKEFANAIIQNDVSKVYAGNYWNAYTNEVYSDLKVPFGAIFLQNNNLQPYYWLVDSKVFNFQKNIKTALLLSEDENNSFSNDLKVTLGAPISYYIKNGMHIYVYDYDLAKHFPSNALADGVLNVNTLYVTNGEIDISKKYMKINPSATQYGPYVYISSGEYRITFIGENFDDDEIKCDVASNKKTTSLDFKEIGRDNGSIHLELTVKDDVDDVEFRMFNNSDKFIKLEQILVEKIYD